MKKLFIILFLFLSCETHLETKRVCILPPGKKIEDVDYSNLEYDKECEIWEEHEHTI